MSRRCIEFRIIIRPRSPCLSYVRQRRHASRLRASIPSAYPVVQSCPAPTCKCSPMPEGLDIDTQQPLNGTMAAYAEHVLICTGKSDWTSRIEDDESSDMARGLKGLLGRGGRFSDPYHNVMITNSSFNPAATTESSSTPEPPTGSAFFFPRFRYFPNIPLGKEALSRFVQSQILPETLHQGHDVLPEEQRNALIRDPDVSETLPGVSDINEAVVLICSHNSRDTRCGVMGPLLQSEFKHKLGLQGWKVKSVEPGSSPAPGEKDKRGKGAALVGLISHVGGHKYAGNVIVYVPKWAKHQLAGCGIWYGRVRPEHVEGIVKETLEKGSIVKDLFRGGITPRGKPIML